MTSSGIRPALVARYTATAADRALKRLQQRTYVRELWTFLASVIAFLTLIRFLRWALSLAFPPRPVVSTSDSSDLEKKGSIDETPNDTYSGRISWRRLPAALASTFRIVMFRLNIPIGPGSVATVVELLFIFGYIAAMFVWLLIDTKDLNSWFYEDRAAHIASSQLPLIVALAGKNNIISFLTGVSHEKLNILHRAAARTCLVLLWTHAICRVTGGLTEKFDFTHGWMRCGATALAAFTLATILSIRPVRNAFFEFFLISHIILIGIFLVGGFIHARDSGFGDYIWPALVVWGFDRVLRSLRLVWNNRVATAKDSKSLATVELVTPDTVRITLRRRFNWNPGQHAYVILPTVSDLPTEAHPFTIASIPEPLNNKYSEDHDVVFIIRGRDGFTSRLREHADRNGVSTVPAYVDGPYGRPPDHTKYTTCILIAGGSGVSYTLPLVLNLVRTAKTQQSVTRRVVFVWSVREAEHIKWISQVLNDALNAAQGTPLIVDLRLYVTGAKTPELAYADDSKDSRISESKAMPSPPACKAPRLMHGRPSVKKMLEEEITTSSGPVSVDVAGPSGLSQSVSRALASHLTSPLNVLRGRASVTLHTETFGMTR